MAMTAPVIPAALVWILYLPLIHWRVARHRRAASSAGQS
jgi:hypothetical protein